MRYGFVEDHGHASFFKDHGDASLQRITPFENGCLQIAYYVNYRNIPGYCCQQSAFLVIVAVTMSWEIFSVM